MIKEVFTNTKLVVSTIAEHLKLAQPRRMVVTMISEPEKDGVGAELILQEREYTPAPARKWADKGKTLHLTLKVNETHVQLQGYIRRDEIQNNRALGDIICMEAEQLANNLEDTESLGKEVES